jgi:hypothetical protein
MALFCYTTFMNWLSLTLFALLWLGIIYALNCAIAGEWKRIEPKQAMLYFFTVALIGVFGELFLDTIYNFFVGQPLWRYNILPIHAGYTSTFAVVVWGLYGIHLYLLHGSLIKKWQLTRRRYLALIISLEALLLEALLTLSAKWLLGDYIYYYLPGDLWHVTSVQNFPFYYICGLVILTTLRKFKPDPVFFSSMCAALLLVVVVLI